MVSPDDIVDLFLDGLKASENEGNPPAQKISKDLPKKGKWGLTLQKPFNPPYTSLPVKRVFFSEYDIKQILKKENKLRIPESAIVSPLAQDWIIEKKIEVIRE